MIEQSVNTFAEAQGYMKTLENTLFKKSRFNNDLLYGMVVMCFEKLFVSLLAHYNINATHHTPMALFKEANRIIKLPIQMKETATLISQFESICSFDGFGYKTPTDSEIVEMIKGLIEVRDYVGQVTQRNLAEVF